MILQPLFDNIVLQKQTTKQTQSGLFLSASETEKSNLATVVAVPKNNPNITLSIGQTVLFYEFASITFSNNANTYYVVKQNDIIAIVQPQKGESK